MINDEAKGMMHWRMKLGAGMEDYKNINTARSKQQTKEREVQYTDKWNEGEQQQGA